ncbi:MAG: CBU_0592 family membrane protein [Planctomycetota bacterium]
MIFSLVFKFNLAALVVEGFWCVISVAGLVGSLRRRGAAESDDEGAGAA